MKIEIITTVTAELLDAFARLIPQLSTAPVPTRAELEQVIAQQGTFLYILRQTTGGPIVGSLTLATFCTPTGRHAWIEDVVVDAACRGQGLGEALTRRALEDARRMGLKSVSLTSRASRVAANQLYQKLGFVRHETNLYRITL